MENDFKQRVKASNSEDEKTRIYALIVKFYESETELTEEEKQEYLSIDSEKIHSNTMYALWYMAKEYMQRGKVDEFTFERATKMKKSPINLKDQITEEMKKDPRPWIKKGQQEGEPR